jgi:DNA-binding NarL/FixJ family response regulator
MIAHPSGAPWAADLARRLGPFPVSLHWPRSDEEALGLAVSGRLHVGVVDGDHPGFGGLELLRRIRRVGLELPCLLVCNNASQRVLQAALDLQVYSVLEADVEAGPSRIADMVIRVGRQFYKLEWTHLAN